MGYDEINDIDECKLYDTIENRQFNGLLLNKNYRYMHDNEDKHVCFKDIYIVDGSNLYFRDHCFVKVSKNIENFMKKLSKKKQNKYNITFSADIFAYLGSNGKKYGLRKIRNIKLINKE